MNSTGKINTDKNKISAEDPAVKNTEKINTEEKNSGEDPGAENRAASNEIKVSISCITFNHERYIEQALEGFLKQKCRFKYEILIHDDASTDRTADIIRDYERRYPGIIRPIYQTENRYSQGISNISGVFNFPRARGKYIAMCEGDDFWTDENKLQLQADYMDSHPDCSLTLHAAEIISEDGAFHSVNTIRPYKRSGTVETRDVISKRSNYPTASLMFRTEDACRLPEWYYDCPVGDIPLQLFMASRGRVYYFDRSMSAYRRGAAGSWSESIDSGDFKSKWEKHFSAMKRLYEAFDRDTGGRYSEACREAEARERFLTDLKEGKLSAIKEPENRSFFREIDLVQRSLMLLQTDHPKIYSAMRKIRLAAVNRS